MCIRDRVRHDVRSFALAISGVLISIPFNYIFGVLARIFTAREKETGKYIFIIGSEVIMLLTFFYAHHHLQHHSSDEIHGFLQAFVLGLLVDWLVLDFIMVLIARTSFGKAWLRFRGFFTDSGTIHESIHYRLIE
eukprot:TRINITY_DN15477_c0_g1_i1.p1 TRINITY_DN15477_c0_g1~~TRINITY_DN15477_c0_g1_i1.p1  ORF type:complete len:135 (-),score=27.42 TRINITY_DN15477_c0_g1_i1:130-534(-)